MKKKDIILMTILCLVSLVLLSLYLMPSKGTDVTVYKDGKIVSSWKLSEKNELKLDTMKIICDGESVWVEDAVCSDKICEKTGKISKGGSSIVCAPERIVIEISGGNVDAEI